MIIQLMQVKANLRRIGEEVLSSPIDGTGIETAIQLRMLCEELYKLLENAHKKGLGYLLPVAFRMVHEARMNVTTPPNFLDLLDEMQGQELIDFEHAGLLVFGDEPEPDIDEPADDEDEQTEDDDEVPF